MWFLAIDCVSALAGFKTRGRIPVQADNTSPRRTEETKTTDFTKKKGLKFIQFQRYPKITR